MLHRIYFDPGMFGFGRLASYDYFAHLEKAISERLRAQGCEVATYVVEVLPTASVRRRAGKLAELVGRTATDDEDVTGPIHLLGHSTGGLDARLVASPSAQLPVDRASMGWIPRLASVTTMNAPHFGTPLATFFATAQGQRMLYAVSALTFIALSLGAPPLAVASALVMAVGRVDRALGVELKVLDRITDSLLGVIDETRSREVRAYLEAIKEDQGSVIQLTPEAMDLFQAGIEDRPGVLYQSTASAAPPPSPRGWLHSIHGAWSVISTPLFATLYSLTSRYDARYPCAAPFAGDEAEALLVRAFDRAPGARANDGVVPLRSQIWGKLVWAGYGDHLDVLGHFRDDRVFLSEKPDAVHIDWLASGAHFNRADFDRLVVAITDGMLEATREDRDRSRAS
jgi:triacylglycerol lipase